MRMVRDRSRGYGVDMRLVGPKVGRGRARGRQVELTVGVSGNIDHEQIIVRLRRSGRSKTNEEWHE